MELVNGIDIQNGMVFGPTIDDIVYTDFTLRFDANLGFGQLNMYLETGNSCTIDWGDGNTTVVSSAGVYDNIYPDSNTYVIQISGEVNYFEPTLGKSGILELLSFGNGGLYGFNFISCPVLVTVPAILPNTVTTLNYAFQNCTILNDANVILWNTSAVTNMANCFAGALAFNQPIDVWDTGNVTTMLRMFAGTTSFNQSLNSWNTSNVTNMNYMFENASAFDGNITAWDTSNVNTFTGTFKGATVFNQDIGNWNVVNAYSMDQMFENATIFDQDLSGWCVIGIGSEPTDFSTGSALSANNKPVWGTCP